MKDREENLYPPEDPRLTLTEEPGREISRGRKAGEVDVLYGCLTLTAFVGLAVYGGKQAVDNFLIKKYLDERYTPAQRENGIGGIERYYGLDDSYETRKIVTGEYDLARNAFMSLAAYELKTDYDQFTEDFIRQQRYDLVIDGVELLQKYYNIEPIDLDKGENTAELDGLRKFDLTNTYDLVLLDATIQTFLDLNDEESSLESRYLARQDFSDLVWLVNANLPVTIRERTFAYPSVDTLPTMGRLYRSLDELGYPSASEIVFRPYVADGKVGFYTGDGEIYLTESAAVSSAVHEEAHHQADKNDDFGQSGFNEMVGDVEERVKEVLGDRDFRRTVYISEYASTNNKENYAEVI